jgi:hypothetical protein
MTPRKKATELFNKYESTIVLNSWCDENTTEDEINSLIKRCALIAVDDIIDAIKINNYSRVDKYEYWLEVKHEIENL